MAEPVTFIGDLAPYDHPQTVYGGGVALPAYTAPSAENQAPSILSQGASPVLDQHRYAWLGGSVSVNVPNGSSALFLSAQNALRNLLVLRNASATANIYIEFGTDAGLNSTLQLQPGQLLLLDSVVPQDDLHAYGDAANALLRYSYSTLGIR
jgi:hypothetical protein